jgi:hypothetical protein
MPDLDSNIHFSGGDNVSPGDLGKVEVDNFSTAVDVALRDGFQWDGKAIGAVALTLNHDNSKVECGFFITCGETNLSEFRAPCDQIWQGGPSDVTLAIRVNSLNPFNFPDGGLWSDLTPRKNFRHHFFDSENTPILEGYADMGIGDFCLRLVFQPSSKSSGRKGVIFKYTILLFPASIEALSDYAESKFPGFPGLKVGDVHFPVGPAPSTKWRCPIVPFIRPDPLPRTATRPPASACATPSPASCAAPASRTSPEAARASPPSGRGSAQILRSWPQTHSPQPGRTIPLSSTCRVSLPLANKKFLGFLSELIGKL